MTRRILAVDGGGVKGVFPLALLASIEEEVGGPIGDYFDLIAGTSTGGIIALGLGLGLAAKDLLSFYEELGRQVFAGNRLMRAIRWLGSAKYKPEGLRNALEQKFRDLTVGDSKRRLIIPSLNLETGEVHVYKTAHHPRFQKDRKEKVVGVALATAAAPSYFPTHRDGSGVPLVDGGMWANNPAAAAVVEAIAVLEWDRGSVRVLSLGCTAAPLDVGLGRRMGMGALYWAFKVTDVFMAGQSSASVGTARLLVGHKNVYRISPAVPPRRFGLDVVKEIDSLKGLGFSEARKALPDVGPVFFQTRAERFEPCPPQQRACAAEKGPDA